ncbi:hypothetical protein BpHYR1_035145 [Brachionus plicatilis]|uniref:Uncharacterized protein n=1 Tax=Brachionus plicatilis TaxID=10195 RepID=A0A3M7SDU9_BRAPC|nr:hypothetical protein BpHYR1_035145 [Brachionus plicatilis]
MVDLVLIRKTFIIIHLCCMILLSSQVERERLIAKDNIFYLIQNVYVCILGPTILKFFINVIELTAKNCEMPQILTRCPITQHDKRKNCFFILALSNCEPGQRLSENNAAII